jgi:hypothetical protein
MLRTWYLSKIAKSKTPMEYFLTMQEFMLYEVNSFSFYLRKYF